MERSSNESVRNQFFPKIFKIKNFHFFDFLDEKLGNELFFKDKILKLEAKKEDLGLQNISLL